MEAMKKEIKRNRGIAHECKMTCNQLINNVSYFFIKSLYNNIINIIIQGNELASFASVSETYRKKYSTELKDALLKQDKLACELQGITSTKLLNEAKYEIIEEQLKLLYESLHTLANAKNLEDKYQF